MMTRGKHCFEQKGWYHHLTFFGRIRGFLWLLMLVFRCSIGLYTVPQWARARILYQMMRWRLHEHAPGDSGTPTRPALVAAVYCSLDLLRN